MATSASPLLTRYWFHSECKVGVGVTAYSIADAIELLAEMGMIAGRDFELEGCSHDIDIRTLDQGHVIPNMEPPNLRGVWFPQLSGQGRS